ncbi:MAG: hypothetical protein AB7I48_09325 [Planctomycetaceae bacterium]
MAILVMGVGLLSVMTLFPIAYLRSIQGAQLTNATLLKIRAEALVDMFGLVTDQFIPQPIEGDVTRCLIDPLGWQDTFGAGVVNINEYGVQNNGGALQTIRYFPSNSPVAVANIPVAPTRFINVAGLGIVRDVWPMPLRRMGFATAAAPTPLAGGFPYSFTSTAVFADRTAALNAVTMPDTFQTQLTGVPAGNTATQVTFSHTFVPVSDLQAIANLPAGSAQVVLIDSTGKRSQVRAPTAVTADTGSGTGTIDWAAAQPLPAAFVNNLSEVRVVSPDPRYTWMLTVRKRGISGGSVTQLDCVVFFNRASEDPEEELVHAVSAPVAADQIPPEDAAYTGRITFTAYPSDPNRVPPLKRGGYVFDPVNAQWYRVQDIISETTTDALIRVDRRPQQQITQLTVPRGVIHVFPMNTRVDASGRKLGQ